MGNASKTGQNIDKTGESGYHLHHSLIIRKHIGQGEKDDIIDSRICKESRYREQGQYPMEDKGRTEAV